MAKSERMLEIMRKIIEHEKAIELLRAEFMALAGDKAKGVPIRWLSLKARVLKWVDDNAVDREFAAGEVVRALDKNAKPEVVHTTLHKLMMSKQLERVRFGIYRRA